MIVRDRARLTGLAGDIVLALAAYSARLPLMARRFLPLGPIWTLWSWSARSPSASSARYQIPRIEPLAICESKHRAVA